MNAEGGLLFALVGWARPLLLSTLALVALGAQACGSDAGGSEPITDEQADANESAAEGLCFVAPLLLQVVIRDLRLPNGIDGPCKTALTNWLNTGSPLTVRIERPDGVIEPYQIPAFTPSTGLTQQQVADAIARLQAAAAQDEDSG